MISAMATVTTMIAAKIVLTMSQSLTRLMTNRFIAKREPFARLLFLLAVKGEYYFEERSGETD